MCGIAGFVNLKRDQSAEDLRTMVRSMTDCLAHRGPDGSGIFVDAPAGIALGHRRLAIIDLSPLGNQPMVSESGRYTLILNGEIYNFQQLREQLANLGHRFRGGSDTEVMLAAFEEWGLQAALPELNGMFAFAVWDRETRKLTLGRDRVGEKPLYYARVSDVFLFGSELKALKQHPEFNPEIDRDALAVYLRHNYIPAPHSIYRGVKKLRPGYWLQISENGDEISNPYWSLREVVKSGAQDPFRGSADEATSELDRLLKQAVLRQMVSDVPLGAFLSGGIDSSTIVALMQAQSSRPVKTFTIGFRDDGFDEAPHARAIARHLGTDHTELYVTAEQAMAAIPELPSIYDEPFADSSQIPTYLVSKLARQAVTVSLSGDAGDELFGGYFSYTAVRKCWSAVGRLPSRSRRLLGRALQSIPPSYWNGATSKPGLGDKLHKLAPLLDADCGEEMFRRFVSHRHAPADWVPGASELPSIFDDPDASSDSDLTHRMMYLDALSYLPDDILVKLDRAAMSVALETRVPLLDHEVIEFAWRVPVEMKIRKGEGKWLLRQVLYRYLPEQHFDRPKTGFSLPLASWLRGPLRSWAEDLLEETRLRNEGYFEPGLVRNMWREHCSGERDWRFGVWDILMFQAWLDREKKGDTIFPHMAETHFAKATPAVD